MNPRTLRPSCPPPTDLYALGNVAFADRTLAPFWPCSAESTRGHLISNPLDFDMFPARQKAQWGLGSS